jgi:hypothetical protein
MITKNFKKTFRISTISILINALELLYNYQLNLLIARSNKLVPPVFSVMGFGRSFKI